MAANPFLAIRAKAGDTEKSLDWYQTQVRALNRASTQPNKLMQNTPLLTTTLLPGNMYMFFYDPKLKEKLPYWDNFPLVIPFRRANEGFYGINLHYLNYPFRFKLLGALHDKAVTGKITEDTRVRTTWKMLLSMSSIAPVKACVKHYLFDQVQSKFLQIKYPDWVVASLLPVERFEGANKAQVWRDSRTKF